MQETAKLCETFKQEAGRINYVTPTSYVELIMAFKSLLASKRAELANAKARYENGLEKINYSAGQIAEMQEELAVLKPGLEVKVGESEVLMEKVRGSPGPTLPHASHPAPSLHIYFCPSPSCSATRTCPPSSCALNQPVRSIHSSAV